VLACRSEADADGFVECLSRLVSLGIEPKLTAKGREAHTNTPILCSLQTLGLIAAGAANRPGWPVNLMDDLAKYWQVLQLNAADLQRMGHSEWRQRVRGLVPTAFPGGG
jgi:hypothetical protein